MIYNSSFHLNVYYYIRFYLNGIINKYKSIYRTK